MPRLEKIRARVGATLLDVVRPGWAEDINLRTLDLGDCDVCVLGQLFGEYHQGAEVVFAMAEDDAERSAMCTRAGFASGEYSSEGWTPYPKLTTAWKDEIRKRRGV